MSTSKPTIPGGLLIIFDGLDGVGKTTQLKLAQKTLEEDGWSVHVAHNLGGSPIGERLREVMLDPIERPPSTDLYISVAIQEALLPVIAAKRGAGNIILMDRGPLSLAAYQIYGSGVDETVGWQYVQRGMAALNPDLVMIYQCDIETAIERARQHSSKADYFESKSLTYFERVSEGFIDAGERYKLEFIDGNRPIEDIHADTWRLISKALAAKNSSTF